MGLQLFELIPIKKLTKRQACFNIMDKHVPLEI